MIENNQIKIIPNTSISLNPLNPPIQDNQAGLIPTISISNITPLSVPIKNIPENAIPQTEISYINSPVATIQTNQTETVPVAEINIIPPNNSIQNIQIEPIPTPSIAYIPSPPTPIQNIQVNPISSMAVSYINSTPTIIQDNQTEPIPTTAISYINPPSPTIQEIQVNPNSLPPATYVNPPLTSIQNIQVNPISNIPPPIFFIENNQIKPNPTITQSYFVPINPTQANQTILQNTPLSISYIIPYQPSFDIDPPIPPSSVPNSQTLFVQQIRQPMANSPDSKIPPVSVQYIMAPIQESPLINNPQAFPTQEMQQPIPATAIPNNSPSLTTQEIDQPINETSNNNIPNPNSLPFSILTYELKENSIDNNLIQTPVLNQNGYNANDNIQKVQELSELRKKVNYNQALIMDLKRRNEQKDMEIMQLRNQLFNNSILAQNQILSQSAPIPASLISLNNNYPRNLEGNFYNIINPNINGFNNIPLSLDVYSKAQNLNYSANILPNPQILENPVLLRSAQQNNMTPTIPIFQNIIPLKENLTTLSIL